MAYAVWLIALALVLILVKQYFASKANHAAAANVVFAKYTFGTLSSDQQLLVKQKAAELSAKDKLEDNLSEIECYAWYAMAMHALDIPSAIPENPNWYHKARPDKVLPSNLLLKSVISFVEKNYDISVEFGAQNATQVASKQIENKPTRLDS